MKRGVLPLHVMLKNMDFYSQKAVELEERMTMALAEYGEMINRECRNAQERKERLDQIERIMGLFYQASDNRMKGQSCARDAAPYLHPRLSQIEVKKTETHPRDLPKSTNIDEVREDFRRLRSMPLETPLATDEQGEPVEAELLEPETEDEAA